MHNIGHRTTRKLCRMVLVALALRLTLMLFVYGQNLDPRLGHWNFGYEEGRVAAALATGHGFSNPLYAPTGPTAWYAPIYPAILAAFFKIFGVYSTAACLAILTLDNLVSALICIPIFVAARKAFGESSATLAGWIWVFFPPAIYGPNVRIWDTWLTALLLATLFCMALRLAETNRVRQWVAFGALSGIVALTDPIVLSVLPFLALWALWRRRKNTSLTIPGLGCLLAVILVITPWTVRNYRVFHQFIPIRDNFGLELAAGNNGDGTWTETLSQGPWLPDGKAGWNQYRRLGEIRYFQIKLGEALAFIREHPAWYAKMIGRRVVNVWTNYWSFTKAYIAKGPYSFITVPLYTALSALTLLGLWRALRREGFSRSAPYVIVLMFFPIVYYLTHTGDWYRAPIDPFFVTLSAYEAVALVTARRIRQTGLQRRERILPLPSEAWLERDASKLVAGQMQVDRAREESSRHWHCPLENPCSCRRQVSG